MTLGSQGQFPRPLDSHLKHYIGDDDEDDHDEDDNDDDGNGDDDDYDSEMDQRITFNAFTRLSAFTSHLKRMYQW